MGVARSLGIILCCLAIAMIVASCGDSAASPSAAGTDTPTRTTPPPKPIKSPFKKPKYPGPQRGKFDHLVVKDIVKGTGPELHAGDTGIFDFIATYYNSGKRLDESWNVKDPFKIAIDEGAVIDGWWQGIPGMRVGGRRTLIVPPSLGFTTNSLRSVRNATFYFDVVLLGVIPAKPAGPTRAQRGDTINLG